MTAPLLSFCEETQRHVVIIEDAPECRRLIRQQLTVEGLEVHEACDGVEGLLLCRRIQPDVILLDLVMPYSDGFTVLRQLKEDPATRSIPVIFLSGRATAEVRAEGLELGAVDFVTKPFHIRELRARVRAALRMREMVEQLEVRAHLDGLTGLGNRLALEERLHAAWAQARRRNAPLAVFIVDLDHFKQINDAYGHAVGDTVLRWVAQNLRDQVREGDFVGRFGGEEFVVVAVDCELAGAVEVAERFRRSIATAPSPVLEGLPRVTVSVGVAAEHQPCRYESCPLLERADRALYKAKLTGRNGVWYYDPELGIDRPAESLNLLLVSSPGYEWDTMQDDR